MVNIFCAGATFEELCHNYGQERLQQMFHDRTITALKERYEAEEISLPDLDYLADLATPQPLVKLIDKQSIARASQADLAQTDKRGLLWLLQLLPRLRSLSGRNCPSSLPQTDNTARQQLLWLPLQQMRPLPIPELL